MNNKKSIDRLSKRQDRINNKIHKLVNVLSNEKKTRLMETNKFYRIQRKITALKAKHGNLERHKQFLHTNKQDNIFIRIYKYFKQMPYQKQKVLWGIVFLSPWIIGFIWFFAVPVITTFYWSFNEVKLVKPGDIQTRPVYFNNYIYAFKELVYGKKIFTQVLLESSWELLTNIPVILILSLIIAVLLNTKFKGSTLIKAIFFIPVIFNSAALKIALTGGMSDQFNNATLTGINLTTTFETFLMSMGIADSIIAFLLSILGRIFEIIKVSGVQILIFLAAIQSISKSLYEAAEIEGATKYEVFWKVTFPIVSPMFVIVIIYTIIDTYTSSQMIDLILTAQKSGKYGLSSALAVIYLLSTLLILILVIAVIRKWVFYYDEKVK